MSKQSVVNKLRRLSHSSQINNNGDDDNSLHRSTSGGEEEDVWRQEVTSVFQNFALDISGTMAPGGAVRKAVAAVQKIGPSSLQQQQLLNGNATTTSSSSSTSNSHHSSLIELKTLRSKVESLEALCTDLQHKWYSSQLEVQRLEQAALACVRDGPVVWYEVTELSTAAVVEEEEEEEQNKEVVLKIDDGDSRKEEVESAKASASAAMKAARDIQNQIDVVTRQLKSALKEKETLLAENQSKEQHIRSLEEEVTHTTKSEKCVNEELRRLRTIMQFSLLKKDSDRLQLVQQHANTMEVELARYKMWQESEKLFGDSEATNPFYRSGAGGGGAGESTEGLGPSTKPPTRPATAGTRRPPPPSASTDGDTDNNGGEESENVPFSTIVDRMKQFAARKKQMQEEQREEEELAAFRRAKQQKRVGSAPMRRSSNQVTMTTTADTYKTPTPTTTTTTAMSRPKTANSTRSRVNNQNNTTVPSCASATYSSGALRRPSSASSSSSWGDRNPRAMAAVLETVGGRVIHRTVGGTMSHSLNNSANAEMGSAGRSSGGAQPSTNRRPSSASTRRPVPQRAFM
eukprot:PhM_4_TR12171/c0_g1_i1/m.106916